MDRADRGRQVLAAGDDRDQEPGGGGDVFIAVVDGLKGFPEAINAVFPETSVQTCIVHMIRHSLNYVGWKEHKAVAADLKSIYRAETAQAAALRLDEFEYKWGDKFPPIGQSWRRNWEQIIPFFAYPEAVRKIIKNRAISPATTPPPSFCTWPCAMSRKSGPSHPDHGNRR